MKHVKAFFIKFIPCLVLLSVILGIFYDMSFGMVFFITLSLAASSYMIGDFIILPRTNNFAATAVDFIFAFFVIWAFSISLTIRGNIVTMSLVAAAGVALFEILFHKYMANQIITNMDHRENRTHNLQFQTEASKELIPSKSDLKINEVKGNRGKE